MEQRTLIHRKAAAMARLHTWLANNSASTPVPNDPRLHIDLRELALLEGLAYALERLPQARPAAAMQPKQARP